MGMKRRTKEKIEIEERNQNERNLKNRQKKNETGEKGKRKENIQ